MTDNAIPLEEFIGPRKPCPFCGSTDLELNCWEEFTVCKNCEASAPVSRWQFRALESELATAKADLARAREAIQNHGLHNYACAHVGASRESAMFEGRPIPACDCWMSAALAPEQKDPKPPIFCDRGTMINQNLPKSLGIGWHVDHTLPPGTIEVWQNGKRIGRIENFGPSEPSKRESHPAPDATFQGLRDAILGTPTQTKEARNG